jgi:hypothetical protein
LNLDSVLNPAYFGAIAAFTGSIVLLVLNWIKDALCDFFIKKEKRNILLLKLLQFIEQYTLECAECLNDAETYQNHEGIAGKMLSSIPKLPDFQSIPDLAILPFNILVEIYSLELVR